MLQPISGIWLAHEIGWSLGEGWLLSSLALYVFTGLFWLPVVFIQMKLRDLARSSAATGRPLPARYYKLYRVWFAFGFPAFLAVIAIFWLMLTRPAIELF